MLPGATYEEAAPVCGTLGAWNLLHDKVRLQPGQRILINGASGSMGTAAVQIARYLGAEVTAVCSGPNTALVRSLGATQVIDYTEQDFTRAGERWDVVFDVVTTSSFRRCRRCLTRDGLYISAVPTLLILLQQLWTARVGRKKGNVVINI